MSRSEISFTNLVKLAHELNEKFVKYFFITLVKAQETSFLALSTTSKYGPYLLFHSLRVYK